MARLQFKTSKMLVPMLSLIKTQYKIDSIGCQEKHRVVLTSPTFIPLSILRQSKDGERSRTANVERGDRGGEVYGKFYFAYRN